MVRRVEVGEYEFIELKTDSDTPLFAAFEIVVNGLIYLLSRENYEEKHKAGKELLTANKISLQTLAPKIFFSRYSLGWLEEDLNRGLRKFLSDKFGDKLQMDFAFTTFPENFECSFNGKELLDALDKRSAVT